MLFSRYVSERKRKGKPLRISFVDIRKAFDTAWVEAHWFATWTLALLRGCGAPWPTSPVERYHKFGTSTESLPLDRPLQSPYQHIGGRNLPCRS